MSLQVDPILPILTTLTWAIVLVGLLVWVGVRKEIHLPFRRIFADHLAQIGEFSFVLAAIGLNLGVVSHFSYQTTLQVIALTLTVSPLWIIPFRSMARRSTRPKG
ncbi:MAG: hypothetical protein RQ754_15685 [Desulfuromonadales bacterium]|nr:hypothetical protein [Desulfuromonadales bacterium]